MGYYSSVSFDISENTVDVKKAKELERYFGSNDSEGVYGFYNVKLGLDGNQLRDIILEEYYAKFYDDELFASKLSEVLKQGKVKLYFAGEDGGQSGYLVSPGNVSDICNYSLTEEEIKIVDKVKEILNGDNTAKKNQLLKILGMEV